MSGTSGDISGPSEYGLIHTSGYDRDALADAIDRYYWRDPPRTHSIRGRSKFAMERRMWREWWRRDRAGETA